jgi:general secretion pathway protein G
MPPCARGSRRGVTLVEILVVVAFAALVAAAVALWRSRSGAGEKRGIAEVEAARIRTAVQQWRADHDPAACPTFSQLQHDRALERGARPDDPWGERYRIRCGGDEVVVLSVGADRREGTADDVVVPASAEG